MQQPKLFRTYCRSRRPTNNWAPRRSALLLHYTESDAFVYAARLLYRPPRARHYIYREREKEREARVNKFKLSWPVR